MMSRRGSSIPLTQVGAAQQHAGHREEAPYRAFLLASLSLAVFGGFLLAVLLPLARALDWGWGRQWTALAQAHGQLQLLGFIGLFIAGVAFRLMPRFSGRELAYPALVRAVIPLVAGGLIVRAVAQPFGPGDARHAALIAGSVLLLGGELAFAAVVWRTLVHPDSKAEATGTFFALGAAAVVAAAAINVVIAAEMTRDGLPVAPAGLQSALLFVELFGFGLLWIGGVATRAVPTFTGRPRGGFGARVAALLLWSAAAAFAAAAIWGEYEGTSRGLARVEDAAVIAAAVALAWIVWFTGVFHPRANRVAAASQTQFWFVRFAMAWLLAGAALSAWYAAPALADGTVVDAFEMDAIRHTFTVGVLTTMVVGMAMLILPEFAGRRLQHPDERWLILGVLAALDIATVLRIWPPIEGLDWLSDTRFWPMAAAGILAETAIIVFALMFVQSYLEQRTPGWATPQALRARKRD